MGMNFLLPIITTLLCLLSFSPSRTAAQWVTDSDGNPLEAGSEYYIQPAGIGFRGGITRTSRQGELGCPLYAVESSSEVDPGKPVKFLPTLKSRFIVLSSTLQIDSGFSAYCRDDGKWRLSFNAWSRGDIVIASGVFDLPRTWFTIEESKTDIGPAYKIATENGRHLHVSRDISGLKVLGATSNADAVLNVQFVKKKTEGDNVIQSATN